MPTQQTDEEILPPRRFNLPSARLRPGLFISDLLVLRSLENPGKHVQRHVQLRRGLNILWADPKIGVRKEGERGSGHAAGKTTFCRLIRYLLGEKHFGPAEHESRIRTAFQQGWVVGRIELEGEPWLVGRAFSGASDSFAVRGLALEEFLAKGLPPECPKDTLFQQALSADFVAPLNRVTFPGGRAPILWGDLLPWYARDQESRLADIAVWRSTASESKSPGSDNDERHFLMRLVLLLLSANETDQFDRHEQLLITKRKLERLRPLRGDRAMQQLRALRSLVDARGQALLADFLIAAAKEKLRERAAAITKLEADVPTEKSVREALQASVEAIEVRAKAQSQISALQKQRTQIEADIAGIEPQRIQAKLDAANRKLPPPAGYCGVPLTPETRKSCPIAKEQPESMAVGYVLERIAEQEAKLIAGLGALDTELKQVGDSLEFLMARERTLNETYQKLHAERNRQLQPLIAGRRDLKNEEARLREAELAVKASERTEANWESNANAIRTSLKKQDSARQERETSRRDFSDLFNHVLNKLMWRDVAGKVEFRGRKLELHADDGQHVVTSGALEIMKIIGFDLTAMIWSMEGHGHHPRFLMHDSPREADMEGDTFRHVFRFVRELEAFFTNGTEPNFQYIITTTEPPPSDLQKVGACLICEPLDASVRDKRFLKEDL